MKTNTPLDRHDLNIKRKYYVLEVGSGHNPSYRANVLVDKYIESNYHRGGNLKKYPHQTFVKFSGEKLPFKDKEFDYVICNQVLEHVEDPVSFVEELVRVSKQGYIETPSFIGESLFPKESHKWVILEIDKKLVMFEKAKTAKIFPNFGITFLNYLPYNSIALRLFYLCNHQVNTVRYEWKDSIDIVVNPSDEKYLSYFTVEWTKEMTTNIFPYKSKQEDFYNTLIAFFHLMKVYLGIFGK